jgi:hypothetical protein
MVVQPTQCNEGPRRAEVEMSKNWFLNLIKVKWKAPSDLLVEQIMAERLEERDPHPSVYCFTSDCFGCEAFTVDEARKLAAAGLFGNDYRWGHGANEHAVHAAEDFVRTCSAAYRKLKDRLERIEEDPRLQVRWQRIIGRQ